MGCCCSTSTKRWEEWEAKMPEMKGKVVAITGCTSGTGLVLAECVARKGAKVFLLNRKSTRADDALEAVKMSATGEAPVAIECDLMSFANVKAAAEQLAKDCKESGIDVLVNNAGIMGFPDKATEDGCDQQMQTNHLSHFLLTALCMPMLEVAASKNGEARIVNHSSAARVMKDMGNKLEAKYLDKNGGNLGGNSSEMFKGPQFQRYQQTKLANVVFTYALHRKLKAKGSKIKALVAHPGVSMDTKLAAYTFDKDKGGVKAPPLPMCCIKKVMKTQSREDATIGILYCTCSPDAKTGEFFGPLGKGGGTGKHDESEYSGKVGLLKKEPFADEEAETLLWEVSERVTGVKFTI
mmetsp:Transcript_41404/g.77058  ORF Transcript_41404/g.77058 Transcript_41404/m.77058 type:complete len:352 (-) Transcript_41404:35-1090(-)